MTKTSSHKNMSTLGFFNYFKKIIGNNIYVFIFLNFLVGLLDSFGLVMFIPILTLAMGEDSQVDEKSSFGSDFLINGVESVGLSLNISTALVFMVLVFILKGIFNYIRNIYFIKLRLFIARTIRFRLVSSFENLSYEHFTKLDSGVVQNSMIGETGRLIASMTHFFNVFQNVIMLITYVTIACFANWQFAILVAIGGVLSNFIYNYLNKITKKYSKRLTFVGANFNGLLLEAINYFKYLKATNHFKVWKKRLHENIFQGEKYNYTIGKIGAISNSSREPIIISIIALVILIQIKFFDSDFGSIMVSLLLFYRALSYLATLQNTWNSFLGVSAGVESVEKILLDFNSNQEKNASKEIETIDDICLQNVKIKYGSKTILNNINLNISSKKSIALVGESGAGKTTLANIISGLIPPQSGDVKIANQSIKDCDISTYRNKIGYITQEPVIFNGTIFENVTFWADKTKENLDKFYTILQMVSLKDFVESLELKEDSPTGNSGILMSGGQKQRISIARELYKDVELLIMDEATSALDSETEKFIKDNIDMLHGKFTMVIIAHRLSTIKNVDCIYLMENGEIIDFGNFNELQKKSKKFRTMVQTQEI